MSSCVASSVEGVQYKKAQQKRKERKKMKEKKKEKMENRHMEREKKWKKKKNIRRKKECASIVIISCNILFVSNVVMYHAM